MRLLELVGSPAKPVYRELNEGCSNLTTAAGLLAEATNAGLPSATGVLSRAEEIKQEGRRSRQETLDVLYRIPYADFDRDDLHRLADGIQAAVKAIAGAAGMVTVVHSNTFPKGISEAGQAIEAMARKVGDCVVGLATGRPPREIAAACRDIEARSEDAVSALRQVTAGLLQAENADPADILKLTLVTDRVREAIQAVCAVSDVLEGMAIENC